MKYYKTGPFGLIKFVPRGPYLLEIWTGGSKSVVTDHPGEQHIIANLCAYLLWCHCHKEAATMSLASYLTDCTILTSCEPPYTS